MSAERYAVSGSSYRAVRDGSDLKDGERLVSQVPESVLSASGIENRKSERALLLRSTDWTQMADARLSAVQRAEMAAYRQALRDLPEQPGFPDCQWPQPPALGEGAASAGTSTFP